MFCAALGVHKTLSTSCTARGNSPAESFTRSLESRVKALLYDSGKDWDQHLLAVAKAHDCTPSVGTGYSFSSFERLYVAVLLVQRYLD